MLRNNSRDNFSVTDTEDKGLSNIRHKYLLNKRVKLSKVSYKSLVIFTKTIFWFAYTGNLLIKFCDKNNVSFALGSMEINSLINQNRFSVGHRMS